jgi:hypothetical protein
VLVDCETGAVEKNAELPPFAGGPPSLCPDGRLFVTDARLESPEGSRRFWGVAVGDFASGEHELVYRFELCITPSGHSPSQNLPTNSAEEALKKGN